MLVYFLQDLPFSHPEGFSTIKAFCCKVGALPDSSVSNTSSIKSILSSEKLLTKFRGFFDFMELYLRVSCPNEARFFLLNQFIPWVLFSAVGFGFNFLFSSCSFGCPDFNHFLQLENFRAHSSRALSAFNMRIFSAMAREKMIACRTILKSRLLWVNQLYSR